ncbi:two-component system, OmpR family, sensor histidine kinase SenX3 [Frankineae bacterium MT45]|nr:two-component system, OmpR family, sensor histidine kinase SenX3 [Frankineae bacterium MT45]
MLLSVVVAVCCALAVGAAVGYVLSGTRKHDEDVPVDEAADPRPATTTDQLPSLVINALSNAVIVVDRSEQVILANPAARAMGLLNADRLDFDELTELVRECTIAGTSSTGLVDLPLDRLGREPIALSATAVPLPDAQAPGRVAAVALLLDDVSETRRLEDVRRDFVANVSHELKTPVGALTLLAEAVQEAADDPEAVQRFAGRMQHEGARLGRLVRELIELSRLQGAEPLPGGDCVNITDVLDEAQDRTRLVAEQAGIEVISRSVGDLKVRGNEGQLTTAVANLVDNAIAYSPRGTRVALSARLGRDAESKPCVEISVSDQGIGLAESDLARVFERFYRVDPARSRATGGTGLGLAIVKHVATNHGGTISVWSVEGAGSTFTIRLPTMQDSGEPATDSLNTEQMTKGSV